LLLLLPLLLPCLCRRSRYKDLLEKSNKKMEEAEDRAVKLQTKMQQSQAK
jgi:hypothetical protein